MKTPLLHNPALLKLAAPLLLGALLLLTWQVLCTAWKVPVYLVPKPSDILATLWSDGPGLLRALAASWPTCPSASRCATRNSASRRPSPPTAAIFRPACWRPAAASCSTIEEPP